MFTEWEPGPATQTLELSLQGQGASKLRPMSLQAPHAPPPQSSTLCTPRLDPRLVDTLVHWAPAPCQEVGLPKVGGISLLGLKRLSAWLVCPQGGIHVCAHALERGPKSPVPPPRLVGSGSDPAVLLPQQQQPSGQPHGARPSLNMAQAAPPSTGPDTPLGIFAPFQSVLVTLPVGGTPRPAVGPLFCITELTARGDLQTPRQGLGSTAAGARGPLAGESRGLRGIPGQGGLSHLDIFIF